MPKNNKKNSTFHTHEPYIKEDEQYNMTSVPSPPCTRAANKYRNQYTSLGFFSIPSNSKLSADHHRVCVWWVPSCYYRGTSHQLPVTWFRDIMQASFQPVYANSVAEGHPSTPTLPRALGVHLSRCSLYRRPPKTRHISSISRTRHILAGSPRPARLTPASFGSASPLLYPAFDGDGPGELPELCSGPVERLPLFVCEVQADLDHAVVGVGERHPLARPRGLLPPHVASPSRQDRKDAQRGDRRESSLPHLSCGGVALSGATSGLFFSPLAGRSTRCGCFVFCAVQRNGGLFIVRRYPRHQEMGTPFITVHHGAPKNS